MDSDVAPEINEVPPVRIEVALSSKVNLADYQNAIPVLRELRGVNETDRPLPALDLRLRSEPPFLREKTWRLEPIPPGSSTRITQLDIQLDGAMLSRLTEAERAITHLSLVARETSEELFSVENSVELLPRNQWGGLSHLPDLIAAFVQPNEPVIDHILKLAADVLHSHGRHTGLDGYQGGPKRAWEIASAIWSAICSRGLDYSLPPANFEQTGQKIRSPAQVWDSGLATCLDLTLLFCSAAEQAGLNPIVVFTKGHAFAGVWLRPEEFSTIVVDDVTALRKRVKLKELLLLETTAAASRSPASFIRATELGESQISEEQEGSFELAVDIRRARMQRIKPLASAVEIATPDPTQSTAPCNPSFDESPELPETFGQPEPEAALLTPKDRIERWQRKLLDLSLRNSLLNFRGTKKSLKIDAPDPGALEDLLSDGLALRILPRPDLLEGNDPRDQQLFESRSQEDLRRAHALDGLRRREIFSAVPREELESRLIELYRSARTHLQEGGSNTLFLAIGFLSWRPADKADQRYRAPLILVPVALNRKSARSGFSLTLHDDEPRFNPTLIEMLRQDFELSLGVADGELPKDDAGLDVAAIWGSVSRAIKDIPGWEVTEDVVLATFSFAKYLMWKDLVERTAQLRQNPVVRHLIDTPRERYASEVAFPQPRQLDREFLPQQTFCPLPADSSQLSAILAAARGKDFVLIGPPGTGKSQTIANLIAQCLAEGKRVLFVSEKIAALDVVYRRLRDVGLGDFCLELHSSKARKTDVLSQLQTAWEARGEIDADEWLQEASRLRSLRERLNRYVDRLHHPHRNGLTIFQAIAHVASGSDVVRLQLSWPSADFHDKPMRASLHELAERLSVQSRALGFTGIDGHPASLISHSDWSPQWQSELMAAVSVLAATAKSVKDASDRYIEALGLPVAQPNRQQRAALVVLARTLPGAFGRDWRFTIQADGHQVAERLKHGAELINEHRRLTGSLSPPWSAATMTACQRALQVLIQFDALNTQLSVPWTKSLVEELERGASLLTKIEESRRQLSARYDAKVEQLDAEQLRQDWLKAEQALWPLSSIAKRGPRGALVSCLEGKGDPDVGNDLALLVHIRTLKSEVERLDPGPLVEGVWAGLKTRPELIRCAVSFQSALKRMREGLTWVDEGYDPIENGRCGDRLLNDLNRLRNMSRLRSEIDTFAWLTTAIDGVWRGLETRRECLDLALKFQIALSRIRRTGSLEPGFSEVDEGACGTILANDAKTLRTRDSVEMRLHTFDDLRGATAGLWNDLDTRLDEVENALKFGAAVTSAISSLDESGTAGRALALAIEQLIGERNSAIEPSGGAVARAGHLYLKQWSTLQAPLDRFGSLGALTEETRKQFEDAPLEQMLNHCDSIARHQNRLNAWCAWQKARKEAVAHGLGPIVLAMERRELEAERVPDAFNTNYCRWWLDTVVNDDEVIRTFISAQHEKDIGDFQRVDERFTKLTHASVRARLCADLPAPDEVSRNSDWGVLRHEMSKKKRHMPLRELIASVPTALTKLTPCLLMSPLSIAQYLSPQAAGFDLVVFDEASQIPVWDAIGAIARGRQVVMVGDPRQLPPTNFFDRAEADADDEDVEGDLESILDECIGANLPTVNLSWHYRSRHESLIAFSNHRYYESRLVTFPSPVTSDRAVSFALTSGQYEKGGARVNKGEARALVSDLVRRMKSGEFRESGLTAGVVTLNIEQKTLIENLLDEERRRDPSLEPYFDDTKSESVFVKNLESVQGDERDIIYFSIGYGPDATGAFSMNFGPMNRTGGERRLNVAITRARHELKVFASFRAEQIDLTKTQAIGVRDLKHFLEFAERGARALSETVAGSLGGFESPFEKAVADALSRKGWEVHTQVGVSSFRIDLAIVDPDAPGRYLAGIECDGATYHRSATARDRDKLRELVLRGLGWNILRIWSTDWWIDAESTAEKVDAGLRALMDVARSQRGEAESQLAALAEPTEQEESVEEVLENQPTYYARNAASNVDLQNSFCSYVESNPAEVVPKIDPEAFFERSYDGSLKQMIEHVVKIEGPVLGSSLARRIARAHGWQRTGTRIQERIEKLARKAHHTTREDVGRFYWHAERGPDQPLQFRAGPARQIDEISIVEITSLARTVLETGTVGEDAVQHIARVLGLQRLRAATRDRIEMAIGKAVGKTSV